MLGVPIPIGLSKATRVPVFEFWETRLKKEKVEGIGLKAVKNSKNGQSIDLAFGEALDLKTHPHAQGVEC